MVKVIPAPLDTKSSTSASAEFVRTLRTAGTDCSGATDPSGATSVSDGKSNTIQKR